MDTEIIFRAILFIILVLMFSISGYYRKKAREDGDVIKRKEEGLLALVIRMVLALPLLASLLLYVLYPDLMAWSQIKLPLWLRSIFIVMAVCCIPILLWVFRSIGRNISETVLIKKEHQLVKTGPYQFVRHPLYGTSIWLLCSFSIIAENWFIFAYFIATLLIFRFFVIPEEEKRLVEAFGEEYQAYQKRTAALFPRFSLKA